MATYDKTKAVDTPPAPELDGWHHCVECGRWTRHRDLRDGRHWCVRCVPVAIGVTVDDADEPPETRWPAKGAVGADPRPCRVCGGPAGWRDQQGRPAHMVCVGAGWAARK